MTETRKVLTKYAPVRKYVHSADSAPGSVSNPSVPTHSSGSHEDPMKEMLLFFARFGWEYGGSEKLRD